MTDLPLPAAPTNISARGGPFVRRFLEVLPPAVVWVMITSPIWAAIFAPAALGFFLVLFSVYWLWKSLSFAGGTVIGFVRMQRAQSRDWAAEGAALPGYSDIRHVVILPTYGESDEILADSLLYLTRQDVPADRIAVVLAFEERDALAPTRAARLTHSFGDRFGHFLVTFHPDLPGEVKGKSSNLAWASQRMEEEWFRSGLLDADDVLVTVCDADSRLHRRYLSALAHSVITHPDGRLHVYQPAIFFYANHWRLPAPLRALNSIYSLWELARMVPEHRLVTQSTYSLTWSVARAVGYWDIDVIPEDSHMFFKVLFHFGRRVRVRPIFLPVYADAAEGPTVDRTLVNQYLQIRRWAWGVSDVPYIVIGALRARDLPWRTRIGRIGWYVEEHLMWPGHWFLLTLGGLLPSLLNPEYAGSPLGIWQAGLISAIMGLCMPLVVIVIFVDWRLRPQHPEGEDAIDVLFGWASFALLPVMGLILCALPALDAHTRLLFGRYLEYRVTEKVPVQARFRSAASSSLSAQRLGRLFGGGRPNQAPQHGAYVPGSTTAVTDSVLLVYRDLR